MSAAASVYQIALPAPLHRLFDYLPPENAPVPVIGARVRVPFGPRRQAVGVVLGTATKSALPRAKLKRIGEVLDSGPVVADSLLALLRWAAEYYHHPIGEVIAAALPALLRQGRSPEAAALTAWRATPAGAQSSAAGELTRARAQASLLTALREAPDELDAQALGERSARWSATIRALEDKGYVSAHPARSFAGVQSGAASRASGRGSSAPQWRQSRRRTGFSVFAARRYRQRQDRGVSRGHRDGDSPRATGTGAGTGNRAHAATGRAFCPPVPGADRGAAFGPDRRRAVVRPGARPRPARRRSSLARARRCSRR